MCIRDRNEIIKDDNAALTSYGLLHREDYQPVQTVCVDERYRARLNAFIDKLIGDCLLYTSRCV